MDQYLVEEEEAVQRIASEETKIFFDEKRLQSLFMRCVSKNIVRAERKEESLTYDEGV